MLSNDIVNIRVYYLYFSV